MTDQQPLIPTELSRRGFFGSMGALALAALWGCRSTNEGGIVEQLPEYQVLSPAQAFPGGTGAALVPAGPAAPPVRLALPGVAPSVMGILPRSAWTRSGPLPGHVEPMNGITRITFHHSGEQSSSKDVAFLGTSAADTIVHLENVRAYHTRPKADGGKGWGDIGYHFAIDRAGRIWQLRSLKYQGAHVLGADPHNVGIVCLGNFNVQEPTAAQKEKLQTFSRLVRGQYKLVRPVGNANSTVFMHCELGMSDCPGKRMRAYLPSIRAAGLL